MAFLKVILCFLNFFRNYIGLILYKIVLEFLKTKNQLTNFNMVFGQQQMNYSRNIGTLFQVHFGYIAEEEILYRLK